MVEMVYYSGSNGWKEEDVELFDNMVKCYIILIEENLGFD